MKYPEESVKKVIDEYSEWPGFSAMLNVALVGEDKSVIKYLLKVGKSLDQNVTADQIIQDIKAGRPDKVLKVAEKCLRRQELYKEWIKSPL